MDNGEALDCDIPKLSGESDDVCGELVIIFWEMIIMLIKKIEKLVMISARKIIFRMVNGVLVSLTKWASSFLLGVSREMCLRMWMEFQPDAGL